MRDYIIYYVRLINIWRASPSKPPSRSDALFVINNYIQYTSLSIIYIYRCQIVKLSTLSNSNISLNNMRCQIVKYRYMLIII